MSNARQRQPSDTPNLPKAPSGSPTQAFTAPSGRSEAEQLVPFSTYTTPEIKQRLRELAFRTGRKQNVIVTEAIRAYLEENNA